MPPVICIVGRSNSGKTTLVEKLLPELKSRGYRVATIKHTPKDDIGDRPGKDSYRHLQAGSEATLIVAPGQLTLMKPMPSGPIPSEPIPPGPVTTETATAETSLEGAVRLLGEDYDVVIAEGFKHQRAPKIEVHRRDVGPLLEAVDGLVALATDEALDGGIRQFSLDDVAGLANLIEQDCIKPGQERVVLCVNGAPVSLKAFPRDIIAGVVTALASCLRGVKDVHSLSIFVRRGREEQDR